MLSVHLHIHRPLWLLGGSTNKKAEEALNAYDMAYLIPVLYHCANLRSNYTFIQFSFCTGSRGEGPANNDCALPSPKFIVDIVLQKYVCPFTSRKKNVSQLQAVMVLLSKSSCISLSYNNEIHRYKVHIHTLKCNDTQYVQNILKWPPF